MTDPLTEDYLRWLESQLRGKQVNDTYWDLVWIMFNKEFSWSVPNDDNRMADGRDLRLDFCYERNLPPETLNYLGEASFLEVLIGLSRRLSFDAGDHPQRWAWRLLDNLKLTKYADPLSPNRARRAKRVIDDCIRRDYRPDGVGGFFPLAWPDADQRQVELWYQMAAYIDELHPEH